MYAFTWTGVRGNIVRELEKPCQMHGGVGPGRRTQYHHGSVRLDPCRLRRLPFRPSAGNPDDGIYLLISREDLDHAGACLNIHPPWCGDAAAAHGGAAVSVRRGLGDQVGLISMRG